MTRQARRPLLPTGAVSLVLGLAACTSASSAAPPAARATIPAAARTVTLRLNYGDNADGRKPPAPATVTSPAKVREVAALVADQPAGPAGTGSCPADDGAALDLAFRAAHSGPALATAVLSVSGCEFTDLTVNGRQHGLGRYGAGHSTATRVLQAAGVAWRLPPMQWPAPTAPAGG